MTSANELFKNIINNKIITCSYKVGFVNFCRNHLRFLDDENVWKVDLIECSNVCHKIDINYFNCALITKITKFWFKPYLNLIPYIKFYIMPYIFSSFIFYVNLQHLCKKENREKFIREDATCFAHTFYFCSSYYIPLQEKKSNVSQTRQSEY